MDILENFVGSMMRMATPFLIGALGLTVSERAGLINIGGEGVMIVGAFTAYAVSLASGSYWLGLLGGIVASMLTILIFAFASITMRVSQVVVGAGINMFCTGLTSFLLRRMYRGAEAVTAGLVAPAFPSLNVEGLTNIPILGSLLFSHNFLVYFGLAMVVVLWFLFNHTSIGLRIIAVGENPRAASGLGIDVQRTRYLATLFSGFMFGAAGAYLSIAQTNVFIENMTGGRGYIAMAVVVLGKWLPQGALLGALLFGAASALQLVFQNQGYGISSHIIMTIPYIFTVLAVVLTSRNRVASPSALGLPYTNKL